MANETKRPKQLSGVKLALLARQIREQTDGLELANAEPIAVIGMGCRFPGGANNPDQYWELLKNGVDVIGEVPPSRWDVNRMYDPDYKTPGKMNTRWGGFLDQIDQFEPGFFGITPREAMQMDPQQRLVLEVAYEALEHAGLLPDKLAGHPVGVYIASSIFDYGHRVLSDINQVEAYALTGNAHCFLANRVSFQFNFRGPSLTLDTACSSSTVALHLAVRALRNRDCDLSLSGGVNLLISPEFAVSLSQWGMLSPDGRCMTFDSRANGFVRAEGCGVVVLKRLSDALADGDQILALIRGTAVNQDGRSTVLTAPNGMAQRAVIRAALANGLVEPQQISYIEAHGTGTSLGDPIEVEALTEVVGQPRPAGDKCFLASVKTNLGHLEAAAGIAGFIKVVLCMQHGVMPPHLHFQQLNPHISLENTPFEIPTEGQPWTPASGRRFAGLSSFGFGGTNGHIVLEEAPALPAPPVEAERYYVLPLSAHSPESLRAMAANAATYLRHTAASLRDVTFTASQRRAQYDYRLAVAGRTADEMAEKLAMLANANKPAAPAQRGRAPQVAFVFSGQGPQWWAMGRELLATEPVFRDVIERCDALLLPYTGWSLLAELTADEADSRLDQTEVAQPAIFALQVALAELWRSWGITPEAVVGHSIGEVAAAHVAGVLSLEEAIRVVYHRARLMQAATGSGKMASVEISEADAAQLVAQYGDRLSIAAVNSPTTTVLSGEPAALDAALAALQAQGITGKLLRVNYAFHSAQMEPFARELTQELNGLQPKPAAVPIYSTVTGAAQDGRGFDAAYWGRNVRQPVRFAAATARLIEDGYSLFVELSPHPALGGMIVQCLEAANHEGKAVASLRRGRGEQETLYTALGELYAAGYPVRWEQFYPVGGKLVALPTYPWQRDRYWFEPKPPVQPQPVLHVSNTHPLLQNRLRSPAIQGTLFESQISPHLPAFLNDHRIWGVPVLPVTAYLDAALSAAAGVLGDNGAVDLEDVLIQEALVLPEDGTKTVQLHVSPAVSGSAAFQLHSLSGEDSWTQHATGRISLVEANGAAHEPFAPEAIQARCAAFPAQEHYNLAWESGVEFGPAFRGVEQLWRRDGEALGFVQLPSALLPDIGLYQIHPVLLDGCIQMMAAALPGYDERLDTYLPVSLGRLRFYHRAGECLWSHVQLQPGVTAGQDVVVGTIQVFDPTGALLLEIQDLRLKRASREALRHIVQRQAGAEVDNWFYQVDWQPVELAVNPPPGRVLIFADSKGVGVAAAQKLGAGKAALVVPGDGYAQLNDDQWQVNPTRPEDFQQLVQAMAASGGFQTIVHLWSLNIPTLAETGGWLPEEQLIGSGSALHLGQALAAANLPAPPALWLVTCGAQSAETPPFAPEQSPVWGFAATLTLEHPDLRCVCVDLDPAAAPESAAALLLKAVSAGSDEDQIALRGEGTYAARLVRSAFHKSAADEPTRLDITAPGVLDNLARVPMTRRPPQSGEVELRVLAAGLNFRDVLNALGMYPGDPGPLGDECVGEVVAVGEGVAGLDVGDVVLAVASGAFASYVTTRAELVIPKPDNLSVTDAATIPMTFLTAYYALHHLAGIHAGDKVLIHAAAGGVGMAAVQLAQYAGAEIFATAGSPEKREYLKALGVAHVMDSRSLNFADEIGQITDGRGVDIVLNSLADEFIPKSLGVLADKGRFLEIGKTGVWTAEQVAQLNPTLAYHIIFLGEQTKNEPAFVQTMLADLMALFETGALRSLPHQVFPIDQAVNAFRYMAQAKHIGKIVLTQSAPVTIRPNATYLITGGTGGIGLQVARWLVEQGARYLVLSSRSGGADSIRVVIEQLEAAGAQVHIAQADIADEQAAADLLAQIRAELPPLRGVIHAAGLIDDGVLLQQDWARFTKVFAPKLQGVWNLHRLTERLPLDFFVLFSAGGAVLGSPGQGNYTAANTFLDMFAQARQAVGLPALSINWGAWDNTGMTAGLEGQSYWSKRGVGAMQPEQAVYALGRALQRQDAARLVVMPINWAEFARGGNKRPFFSEMVRGVQSQPRAVQTAEGVQSDLLRRWPDTAPNRRRKLLLDFIREEVIRVLGLRSTQPIDPRQPLNELGLDSLMAVEMRNALGSAVGMTLPATLLFDYPTSDALADYLLKSVPALAEPDAEPEAVSDGGTAELHDLTEAQAEALLLAELDELDKGKKKHG